MHISGRFPAHIIRSACALLLVSAVAIAQVDEARQAIDRGEYVRAVNILSQALADQPSPDVYLYLGIAYGHIKENQKAEDVLREGSRRYPEDSRFHAELANLFLDTNDVEAAKSELKLVLAIDPTNNFASDQLATIDMSRGEVQGALRAWNKSGRPYINDILHNYYLNYGSWVVKRAVAFRPAGTLRYSQWRTTEARLFETGNFTNVGLEIEPTRIPDQYNAVVRTTRKTNTLPDFAFNILKGAVYETSYVNVWNIANTGMNFNGDYRWSTNKRRLDGALKIPLPLAGLSFVDVGSTWRSENWNTSIQIEPQFQQSALFKYGATDIFARFKTIPNYRVELAGGFVYKNRYANGNIPQLVLNSQNTGKFIAETNLRFNDGTYQNRLHLEGFAARPSVIGNTQFTGGVAELNNRVTFSKETGAYFDWSVNGGTVRGNNVPVDEYFVLGLDTIPNINLLRAHTASRFGKYGNGPMGTDFVLINTDFERRLATIPFFNNLNIPYVRAKWEVFVDGAKTWDRQHVFQPSELLIDIGGGIRLETPTHSFNLIYGKSLQDGRNVFYGYVEKRLW